MVQYILYLNNLISMDITVRTITGAPNKNPASVRPFNRVKTYERRLMKGMLSRPVRISSELER